MPKPHPESTDSKASLEWSTLSGALIVLSLSLSISAVLVVSSYQYRNYIERWTRQQRSDFNKIETEYSQVQEALEIVDNLYLDKFYQLEKEGFFLNRLNINLEAARPKMLDDIKAILSKLPLFSANFEVSGKQIYEVLDLFVAPEFKTYETQLVLKFSLLHEGDMLNLIKAMEFHNFTGLTNLQQCDIQRLNKSIDVKEVSKPYLDANCTLMWYVSNIEEEIGE